MPGYMPSLTTTKTIHSFTLAEASSITYGDETLATTDHTYTGWKINATAGETVVFPNLCYFKNDGKFWKTDADAAGTTEGLLAIAVAIVTGGRYEYYNTRYDTDADAHGVAWKAQTFTPSVAHTITSVKLLIRRSGLPGIITVGIRATDGSGHPTGADLCSGTTAGDSLTDTWPGEWREITLGAGYDLDADTKYAIVVRALTGDGTNEVVWQSDNTSPIYAGGNYEASFTSGVSWTSSTDKDFMFEEWGVAIAPPTGFLLRGFIRDDTWAWTVGGIIYVSLTAGEFTQTAPTVSGDQVRKVGVAISADVMWFNPDATVTEIP